MLKVRLMRIGTKKKPFYRVVVVDERSKRTGGFIELLGSYNPLTEPKDIKLKTDRIDYWVKQGAQMSDGFLRIIGKAPQRPPRKPKKEKKEESPAVSPQSSDKTEAQATAEATPASEPISEQPAAEAGESPVETQEESDTHLGGEIRTKPSTHLRGEATEVSKSGEEPEPQPETPSEPEKEVK